MENKMMGGQQGGNMCGHHDMCGCRCMHHKVWPLLIIVFGLMFLLRAVGSVTWETVNIVWPLIVIGLGISKLFRGMCKCC